MRPRDVVGCVRGRGQAKDGQINESRSPLLLSFLHGEGAEGGRGCYKYFHATIIRKRIFMYYNHNNLNNAKSMRSNMTDAEAKMWYYLRAKRFFALKFKRQVLIGNYIADFVCETKKIIIEIDGGQHNENDNIVQDKQRSFYLENNGYKVLRFWNNDVLNNIEGVLEVIRREVFKNR